MKLGRGALTFEQAEAGPALVDEIAADGRVELADVDHVDSAGVALLLDAARRARRRGGSLELIDPPEQLRTLLAFFGVAHVFGLPSVAAAE